MKDIQTEFPREIDPEYLSGDRFLRIYLCRIVTGARAEIMCVRKIDSVKDQAGLQMFSVMKLPLTLTYVLHLSRTMHYVNGSYTTMKNKIEQIELEMSRVKG